MFYRIWTFISSRRRDLLMLFTALFNRDTPRTIRMMIIAAFYFGEKKNSFCEKLKAKGGNIKWIKNKAHVMMI